MALERTLKHRQLNSILKVVSSKKNGSVQTYHNLGIFLNEHLVHGLLSENAISASSHSTMWCNIKHIASSRIPHETFISRFYISFSLVGKTSSFIFSRSVWREILLHYHVVQICKLFWSCSLVNYPNFRASYFTWSDRLGLNVMINSSNGHFPSALNYTQS